MDIVVAMSTMERMLRKQLELLIDPIDGSPLDLCDAVEGDGRVVSGVLVGRSGRRYRIDAGVPRFVDDDEHLASFSFEWRRHATTLLDGRLDGDAARAFVTYTAFDAPLVAGARVLDAGVGSGRLADVALRLGAAEVIGLDLSFAVDSAQENLGRDPRFGCVQASIFAPPFPDGSFDLIYSVGVLHHTPAPQLAFARLARLLRPGGHIAIYVYEDTPTHVVSDALRQLTTRLSPSTLHRVVSRLQPILDGIDGVPFGQWLLRWLPRSHNATREARILDNFDWYSPRFQFRYRGWQETARWFTDAGLVDVRPLMKRIAIVGRRPRAASGTVDGSLPALSSVSG